MVLIIIYNDYNINIIKFLLLVKSACWLQSIKCRVSYFLTFLLSPRIFPPHAPLRLAVCISNVGGWALVMFEAEH